MSPMDNNIAKNEIAHGERLARGNPEDAWGWSTPAGKKRALRRALMIMESAGLGAESSVLEIGCGTGLFTEYFSRCGANIVAVDISHELIARARERGLPADRIRFVEGAFEECHFPIPFDAIIGSSVLHHLDLDVAIIKIYQLLKPGGTISFTEPNMLNPQIMIQKNIPWIKDRLGDSPDETAFFSWDIKSKLKKTGFQDIMVRPFDWLHPAIPELLVDRVSRIGAVLEGMTLIKEFSGSLHISARRPGQSAKC